MLLLDPVFANNEYIIHTNPTITLYKANTTILRSVMLWINWISTDGICIWSESVDWAPIITKANSNPERWGWNRRVSHRRRRVLDEATASRSFLLSNVHFIARKFVYIWKSEHIICVAELMATRIIHILHLIRFPTGKVQSHIASVMDIRRKGSSWLNLINCHPDSLITNSFSWIRIV